MSTIKYKVIQPLTEGTFEVDGAAWHVKYDLETKQIIEENYSPAIADMSMEQMFAFGMLRAGLDAIGELPSEDMAHKDGKRIDVA